MNRSDWFIPAIISALAFAAGFEPAHAEDRAALDRCEVKLSACYEICKTEKPSLLCNEQCSTVLCGFAWREGYGRFIDRRIEETAGTGLPGLLTKEGIRAASK